MTTRDYNRWKRLSLTICPTKEQAEEVLHNVILKFLEKEIPDTKLTDNYVFISLRNEFLDHTGRGNKNSYRHFLSDIDKYSDIEYTNLPLHEESSSTLDETVLSEVESYFSTLSSAEQLLFNLHLRYRVSLREISRKTGISLNNLASRIIRMKNHLKEIKSTIE